MNLLAFFRPAALAATIAFSVLCVTSSHADFDHRPVFSTFEYEGPRSCALCHNEELQDMLNTVHYRFQSELPDGYQFDEHGDEVTFQYSGKLWKLCGFPTTLPQFNWLGVLADDPATPHVDKTGGCAKCHIGIGLKPYTATGNSVPQVADLDNIDCLVCHAKSYQRKFYVAKTDGQPDLNPLGAPVVLAVPRLDGELDWSVHREAAKTVGGRPTSEACLQCHAAAGGGTFQADTYNYASFKRGSIYGRGADVHADAGMTCADCHYAGDHKMKRPLNNDLSAHDVIVDHQMCTDCHSAKAHLDNRYNKHTEKIACTTCHATSKGGITYKDFSQSVAPDPNDPLGLYAVAISTTQGDTALSYKWFNGTVGHEIAPLGSREDGRIYPFRPVAFNQPLDASGHPIPVKWGIFFKTGNMQQAIASGRSLYAGLYSDAKGAKYGIPPMPGEFDHFGSIPCGGFSVSHGITKVNALHCTDCHSHESGLDFATLGYSAEETEHLVNVNTTPAKRWMIYR